MTAAQQRAPAGLPAMADPTICLSPTQGALLLTIPQPEGAAKEFPIPATLAGMDLLVGILRRHANSQRPPLTEPPAFVPTYPPGQELRFTPPHPSPWREVAFFPRGADFCPVIVVAEHKSGSVLCSAPDGHSYLLPPVHLRLPGQLHAHRRATTGEGLTLADLGL